nr:PREDICTED: dual specificity protein phosphatase 4 [Opisthocomus hoazin]
MACACVHEWGFRPVKCFDMFRIDLTLALAQEITEKQELGRAVQPGFMFQRRFRPSPAKVSIRLRLRKKAWFQSSPGITLCASLLAGGYERFSSEYPEFCAKTKSLSNVSPPTSAEPLDLGCSSCGTPFHDQGGPVEILPFLYLGSAYHASRKDMLDALGITALINVSANCPNHFEGHYQYKCIPVEDNHKADISSWFMEAIEYIDSVKECCGRVLVHCQAGISRSATICLAYLMMKKRVKLEEAFEFVKQRRSIISPNFSFMGQLLQFESQVLATSCAVEAVSPSGTLRERGKATSTPTSQFVFSFPVSVGVHATPSSLPYLHSPITTSPSC